MQSNVPYDRDEPTGARRESGGSILDQPVTIAVLSKAWIVAAVALVAAMLLRLPDLDRWALSAAEGRIALAARGLVTGERLPDDMLGMPTVIDWLALVMFGGDTVETVGRIAMAIAGILIIPGVILLGRLIGTAQAIAAAVLLAFSPTMVAASRSLDGGILLPLLSLAVLLTLLMTQHRDGLVWPALAGFSVGLLLLSGPLGIPAVLLTGLGFVLLVEPAAGTNRDALIAGVATFVGTVVLVGTAFFTRPEALPLSLAELFSQFWTEHLAEAGDRFHMVAFDLLFNEPLLILLAIVALVARDEYPQAIPLALWSTVAFVVLSLLGGAGTAGYTLIVLPLGLLAGVGAIHVIRRLPWYADNRGHAALYALLILLLGAALLSVAGLMSGATGQNDSSALPRIALLLAIVVVPLAVGLAALGQRITGMRLLVLIAAVIVVFGAITVRSSVLAASDRPGQPGSMLTANASSPSVPIIVERLDRISRDVTLTDRDARDPTGGHGLRIAIDERIAQPFSWYFRNYPNAFVFDPASDQIPGGTQVVLLAGMRDPQTVAPDFEGQSYLLGYQAPDIYESPDWSSLIAGVFEIDGWRRLGDFLLNRELSNQPEPRQFQVLAIPSIGERLFPSTGPYSLNDRAGAGAADGQFNQPRGIAVADDGSVYVVDSGNHRVQRFTPDGAFDVWFGGEGDAEGEFGSFPGSGVGGPSGIAIGPEGNIYVTDTWNHRIQVFTPDGEFLRAWGSYFDAQDDPERTATEPGRFYGPRGIAIHDNMVFVTDTGNERIQVFDLQGQFIRMFGTKGSESGQLIEPVGIAVTGDGTVLVADSHNARITRFTLEGEPLDPWPVPAWENLQFFEPFLALGPEGRLYASSSATGEVIVLSAGGEVLGSATSPELTRPYGVAVLDGGDRLLVTDGIVNGVLRVSADLE